MNTSTMRGLLVALAVVTATGLPTRAELKHRYSFDGDASDSVGAAHGALEGEAVASGGTIILDGTEGTYINLPGGLVEGFTEVSFEAWVSFWPGDNWTRIFDFGGIANTVGRNYVMFTPRSGNGDTRLSISDADPGYNHEEMVILPGTLDDGSLRHVVAVLKPEHGWAAIYVDGVLSGFSREITIPLSEIASDNCFLGRSLYAADGWLNADLHEFRVLDHALSSGEVAASFNDGSSAVTYAPGQLLALDLLLPQQMPENGVAVPEVSADYANVGLVTLGPIEFELSSSDPSVVEVRADGSLLGKAPGNALITVDLDGEQATASIAVQSAPVELAHRYSFSEAEGAFEVVDSVGGETGVTFPSADGVNEVTFGGGQALFPGGASYEDGAYIELPDGIVSSMQNITIEVWSTWNGPAGSFWQRVFDFGNSAKGDNPHNSGNGTGALFLSPLGGNGVVRFNASPTGFAGEQFLNGAAILPVGQETHVVCVYSPDRRVSQLWVDGKLVDHGTAPFSLADLRDDNNWLGVSGWNDPPFNGSINELRLYEGGLTELEIALNREAGPDALADSPGTLQAIRLEAPPLLQGNPAAVPAILRADYENIRNVDVSSLSSSAFASSDPDVFTVTSEGAIRVVGLGSADLEATYLGLTVIETVTVLEPTGLTLAVVSPLFAGGPTVAPELMATFPGDLQANVAGFTGAELTAVRPEVAAVDPDTGDLVPLAPGGSGLDASYGGQSATANVSVELPAGYRQAEIVHRYSFGEAPGAIAVADSVGSADGELVNPGVDSDFTGSGRLKLAGGPWNAAAPSGYVNLPNALVSSLTSMTLEGWASWAGPADSSWQRIFDFGRNASPDEDVYQNPGRSYTFLTPRSDDNTLRFAIKEGEGAELPQLNSAPWPLDEDIHFTVVYDTPAGTVRMYVNGQRVATGLVTHPLSVLEDVNVYLGRSQWTDPLFAGEFDEFRVYRGTLLDGEVQRTFAAGPDVLLDLTPAPELEATLEGADLVIRWPSAAAGFSLQSSMRIGSEAAWTDVAQPPIEENGMLKVTVPVTGQAAFYRLSN